MSRGSRQPHSGVIDLTAHRTAAILFKKRLFPLERAHQRRLERTAPNRLRRRGPPERHAAIRKPAGETNGARRILAAVPRPSTGSPTALRQHPVRHALVAKCLAPCAPHPGATSDPSPQQARQDPCRRRHKVGNQGATLKDWRGIATRSDRCSTSPAICIAAAVIFCCVQEALSPVARVEGTWRAVSHEDEHYGGAIVRLAPPGAIARGSSHWEPHETRRRSARRCASCPDARCLA